MLVWGDRTNMSLLATLDFSKKREEHSGVRALSLSDDVMDPATGPKLLCV